MAQLLGNVAVGTVLKLKENGSPQNYIVVHQGLPSSMYDSSCNGTWLLRQDIVANSQWSSTGGNYLAGPGFKSTIMEYLENTQFPKYDTSIQDVIKTVKIPFCLGGGVSTVNTGSAGLPCQLFPLGGYEVGWTTSNSQYFPIDGAVLSYFQGASNSKRIAKLNGAAYDWWLRSPAINSNINAWRVTDIGIYESFWVANNNGIRPAMVMPTNLIVDDSNNITSNQLVPPTSISVPSLAMQQQPIPISWTPVSIPGTDVTYKLQRNADNGGWTTIYTGADTSYTDTVGTWTQVQYQIATVALGTTSDYTQSSIIPVSDPQTLVISGQDGNLGTLTSNLPYTVSSNTGNPISLTRTVNGAQVVTLTVESGFAYSIPIADLPTGTGTIQITASVENTSQQIQTQTRTWTYYKTPINIPSTGGVAQLTQNGQNIWPVTVPDAVEAPVYLGGNLNAALNKLGQAALYTKIGSPKYNQVTVDLSKVKVGDEVLLNENGAAVPFIVGSLNYEPTLNTSENRVLLIRKSSYISIAWNATNVNTYINSTVDTWLNNTYKNLLGEEIQNNIGVTTFKYTPGNGDWSVSNLSRAVFLLSATELGMNDEYLNDEGEKLTNSENLGGITQWTRSPTTNNNSNVWRILAGNRLNYNSCYVSDAIRPCFTLPTTFNQVYYIGNNNTIYPSQEYTTGGSITDVFGYDVPICQYETGSYVGTGTYGSRSPNSLTFSFKPKIVFISDELGVADTSYFSNFWIYGQQRGKSAQTVNGLMYFVYLNWNNLSFSWYSSSSSGQQLNSSGHNYIYVAIG